MSSRELLLDLAGRLDREREEARPKIARLRTELERAWDHTLPRSWRTAGFVQELTEIASSILEQNPRESLALGQFALGIAAAIPRGEYPAITLAHIEGRAWKELGTAHRYLSEYAAALRAYDAAQHTLAAHGALAHDAATVDLAKAVVLSEMGRYDEALDLVRACEPVLRSFGDERRRIHAAMIVAMVQHRRGDLAAARAAYETALVAARTGDDVHTIAALYNNLALVCVELNDSNAASIAIAHARELFRELGMPLEVTRAEIALARLLMHNGEYRQAIPLLQRLREEFLKAGMIDEAGVAALDIVDAYVATNQRDAAIHLVNVVLDEYRAAKIDRAVVALAYLRDLVRNHPAPAGGIRHVREFMNEMRSDPARVFVPLPE